MSGMVRNYLAAMGRCDRCTFRKNTADICRIPVHQRRTVWQAAREARVAGAAGYISYRRWFQPGWKRDILGNLDAEELAALDRIAAQSRGESAQVSAVRSGGVTMPPARRSRPPTAQFGDWEENGVNKQRTTSCGLGRLPAPPRRHGVRLRCRPVLALRCRQLGGGSGSICH